MHGASDPISGQYAARRRAERRQYPAVLALALAVSALIHLATLLTVSFEAPAPVPYAIETPTELVDVSPVMRAYDLVTVDTDVAPIEVQIIERQLLREAQTEFRAPASALPAAPPPTERRPSAPVHERLQYRVGSVRDVWRPAPSAEPGVLTPIERVESRIASSLQEYNDSVAGEAARRARATDWTVADADGGRWGVSPGKLHLGEITLPLPVHFSPTEEYATRIRDFNEMRIQAAMVEGREVFDDRVRAIRERMDAERRARMAGDTLRAGGGRTGGGPDR